MSGANTENAEEQDQEPINSSSEHSTTSSCSSSTEATSTTTSTTSSSTSSDTSSISSASSSTTATTTTTNNDEDDDEVIHHHRHCPKSIGPSGGSQVGDSDRNNQLDANHDKVTDGLKSTTGQKCDTTASTRTIPECSCATKSQIPTRTIGTLVERTCCCQRVMPASSSQMQADQTTLENVQDHPKCNQSTSNNKLSGVVEQKGNNTDIKDNYHRHPDRYFTTTSLGSSYSNLSSNALEPPATNNDDAQSRRTLRPATSPSPSMSVIDTNNNKNNESSGNSPREGLTSIRRTNFSKSASGSRLVSRSRPNVCDCLSQDCAEKKHSNRRQFIEQYYNNRTRLPTGGTSTSSFNISTPLNRLSECDAITKRLLSSPKRVAQNLVESPTRRSQVSDVDKSRRASLGTNTITDQVFLFASSPFKFLELSYRSRGENQRKLDSGGANTSEEKDAKLKQQGRSLSVCDEETLKPKARNSSTNYSSNLNRTISLACESGTSSSASRRPLTIIPLFGCDIRALEQFTKLGLVLPPVIDSAVDHILVNGINSVGIFRKSGVKSRILTLKQKIETNQNLKFNELNQNNEFSIYDIADLVKMWFRELKPLPLMTKEIIKLVTTFLNSSSSAPNASFTKRGLSSQQDTKTTSASRSNITTVRHVDPSLKSKIDTMTTPTHRALLLRALNFLSQISMKCEFNQMTSQNLAICLTPSLCAAESDQSSILLAQKALEFCIDNHRSLFGRAGE